MRFLLDTNVVSEPMKPQPNADVLAWLAEVDEDSVFMSVITIMELRYGIERLAAGTKRNRLDAWLQRGLPTRFEGRILPIDLELADACGRLMARSESIGRSVQVSDAFLAATAEVYGLTLVTRNASHFQAITSKPVLTPWT